MNGLKAAGIAGVLMCALCAAPAQTTVTNTFSGVDVSIPDGDSNGVSNVQTLAFPGMTSISDIKVTLTIAGGTGGAWNGDFYVLLKHDGAESVLLNRVGRLTGDEFDLGYGSAGATDNGFDLTLSQGGNDLHSYHNFSPDYNTDGQLTGEWGPDGRIADPALVDSSVSYDTMARNATLNALYGMDPNGTWTLFLADLSTGSEGTLVNWGIVVTSIPEPSTGGLICLGGLLLAFRLWRRSR